MHISADLQGIAAEYGRRASAVYRADLQTTLLFRMRAEESEDTCRGDDADRLPAECKTVSAVCKSLPRHAALPLRQHARQYVAPHGAVFPEGARSRKDADSERAASSDDERHGRAFQIKPCPVGGFNVEKGINGRQESAKNERESEEQSNRNDVSLCPFPACGDQDDRRSGQKLHSIRRPARKRDQRKDDRKRAAQRRCCKQPQRARPHAGASYGKIQQQAVQNGVFEKCVLPIDDHVPLPLRICHYKPAGGAERKKSRRNASKSVGNFSDASCHYVQNMIY